jgi:DNA-binding response OmpR family regulator
MDGRGSPAVPKGRVLVVDDSRFVREFVTQILQSAGHEVGQAEDGAVALRKLESEAYDVIVTDLNMPMLNGFAVLEKVKLRGLSSEVIILTGSHAKDTNAAIRALRLGAHDYLTKPLIGPENADQTVLAVERALEKKRQLEALREAEQRYRALYEWLPIGLYRSTLDGQILEVNPAMVSLLRYPDRETLIRTPAEAIYVDSAERQVWVETVVRMGAVERWVAQLKRYDGCAIQVEECTRLVCGATGSQKLEGCMRASAEP